GSQFDTALVNMVVNARDAMSGAGKLVIKVECAAHCTADEPASHSAGDYVKVSLTDTGAGIAKEKLGLIFEPFYTTKSVGQGTGLGLSQVFGFAKQSGGEVLDFWHEPMLLVAGAAWYGLLSVLWQMLFSNQPVQQALARLFRELGQYLKLKSTLFEPIRTLNVEARRLELAQQNGKVVAALNSTKEIILHRVGSG
ncbi:hypothetical protein PSYPI_37146, partial [Pseudomonas syringae pv. pisi str. 1704B]